MQYAKSVVSLGEVKGGEGKGNEYEAQVSPLQCSSREEKVSGLHAAQMTRTYFLIK